MEEKIESFRKEQEKELDIIKNTVGREVAIKTWSEIAESLREMTELFFQYATYEELKDLVNLVIDKVIVPVDKEQSVKIRLKLPFRIELAERYMEEEMEIIQDECGMNHILGPTGKIIPKKFNLDPTKNPLKYRTVEFKD